MLLAKSILEGAIVGFLLCRRLRSCGRFTLGCGRGLLGDGLWDFLCCILFLLLDAKRIHEFALLLGGDRFDQNVCQGKLLICELLNVVLQDDLVFLVRRHPHGVH